MTTIPTLTPLSTPVPNQSDPVNFADRMDTFLGELPTLVDEQNLAIAAINTVNTEVSGNAATASSASTAAVTAGTLIATVGTSLSLTTGAKSISWSESGRTFANTRQATLVRASDPTQKMWGALSSVDNTAKTATLTISTSDNIAGSGGPYTDWILMDSWLERLSEATVAQVWAKTAHVAVSPDVGRDANAEQAVTMGATVTVDGSAGLRRSLACNGNFTLAPPINVDPGDVVEINILHSASGSVMDLDTAKLRRPNGKGVLSTTSGYRDKIIMVIETVDGSRVCTRATYQVLRNV